MKIVKWLHLSDLHFKSGNDEIFNRNIVLKSLWLDIKKQVQEGLQPDFIVVSGDIAYHGKKEEYQLTINNFFNRF